MLQRSGLHTLDSHLYYLHQHIPNTTTYIVGGAVRDILLGRDTDPRDIDLTAPGNPEEIRARLDPDAPGSVYDFFATEKFGTMTLMPRSEVNGNNRLQYELTPLRTEDGYTDKRHPDQIHRSSDIILDSQRRDFTINALYYTSLTFEHLAANDNVYDYDEDVMFKHLDSNQVALVGDILIIQSPELVSLAFPDGIPSPTYLFALTKQLSPDNQPNQLGIIIDPHQGIQDLRDQKIRCVGDADQRIHEDALRIIRALRLVIQLNHDYAFDFHKYTRSALQKRYFQIQHVAKERIIQEIHKVLHTDNFFGFVALMDEINILQYIFPAVARTKHIDQPVRYHPFDVYTHSLMVLRHTEGLNSDPDLKLAALYHDVGKREQYHMQSVKMTIDEGRKMYGSRVNHTICGVDHTHADMSALGISKNSRELIKRYVANHMKPGEILMSKPDKRQHKLRLLMSEAGYQPIRNLLDLTLADRHGQYNPLQSNNEDGVRRLIELLDELHASEGQFVLSDMAVSGHDIMQSLKLDPGPEIKIQLQKAFERVLKDIENRNVKKKILRYLK